MAPETSFSHPLIGKVLVIHVKSFVDREAHMREELGRFGIPFEFVLDHDAVELTPEVEANYFTPGNHLSPAAKSCCLKHLMALKTISTLPKGQLGLVLEDDVVLADNFVELLVQAAEEAAQLNTPCTVQLGCANNMHVPRHLLRKGRRLYKASQVRAADSYLIDPESARRRYEYLCRHKIALTADHLFNKIDKTLGIQFYWLEPTIVEQGSMNGKFHSAIDDKRRTRSLTSQSVHYHLKRLRIAIFDPIFRRNRRF